MKTILERDFLIILNLIIQFCKGNLAHFNDFIDCDFQNLDKNHV